MQRSLENRARRLEENLTKAEKIIGSAPPQLPEPEELEEMEDNQRELFENILAAITLSENAEQIREEIVFPVKFGSPRHNAI